MARRLGLLPTASQRACSPVPTTPTLWLPFTAVQRQVEALGADLRGCSAIDCRARSKLCFAPRVRPLRSRIQTRILWIAAPVPGQTLRPSARACKWAPASPANASRPAGCFAATIPRLIRAWIASSAALSVFVRCSPRRCAWRKINRHR